MPQNVSRETKREIGMEDCIASSVLMDDDLAGQAPVQPLPWRQCAPLMFFGSLACYGLGFLVAAGFSHILSLI